MVMSVAQRSLRVLCNVSFIRYDWSRVIVILPIVNRQTEMIHCCSSSPQVHSLMGKHSFGINK